MDNTTIANTFKAVSVIFAVAAVFTGLQAIINPARFAKSFGVPLHQPVHKATKAAEAKHEPRTHETATSSSYIALLGARQLGTGITLLIFAYQGKWIESATILMIIGVLVAGMDGYYIARCGSLGGGLFHAVPGVCVAALAAGALWGDV